MNDRQIQERQEFPSGIKTEWEPTRLPKTDAKDARNTVMELNHEAKKNGDSTRYRSVAVE